MKRLAHIVIRVFTVSMLSVLLVACAQIGSKSSTTSTTDDIVMAHDIVLNWLAPGFTSAERNSFITDQSGKKTAKGPEGAKDNYYPEILPSYAGEQSIVFPSTEWGMASNMNYSFFTSSDKVYEIGTMRGGFLQRGVIWGDESGVWSQPYKMLDGVLVEILFGDRVWTLNDSRHFTNHLSGVSFLFEQEGIEVERTDFAVEAEYAFVHMLKIANRAVTEKKITVRFIFQENIRPIWHKPWTHGYGVDSISFRSNSCFVAYDPLIKDLEIAFGGAKPADRQYIDTRNPYRNRGVLEYDLMIHPGLSQSLDFLTVLADQKKMTAVLPKEDVISASAYFEKLKPQIAQLWIKKQEIYQKIFTEEANFICPDTALNLAWKSAQYNLKALQTDVRPYLPFPYLMTCPERAYQLLFGIDPLYSSKGTVIAGFPEIIRQTLLNHHHFSADIDYTSIPYMVNQWGEHDGSGSRAQETTQYIATAWEYAKLTGDLSFCKQMYADLKRMWEGTLSKDTDHDYWPEGMTFPGISERSGADEMISAAVRMVWATKAMGEMAAALGRNEDAQAFLSLAEELRKRFNKEWWSEEKSCWAVGLKNGPAEDNQIFLPDFHYGSVNYPARYEIADQEKGKLALQTVWNNAVDELDGFNAPAVTAWQSSNMAIACYNYGRPDLGLRLLKRTSLNPVKLEKMLGTFSTVNPYPSQPSKNENKLMYNWGAGPYMEAIVTGLLGIEANAFTHIIQFDPQIPEEWREVSLFNYKVGNQIFDFEYKKPYWKISSRAGDQSYEIRTSVEGDSIMLAPFSTINI